PESGESPRGATAAGGTPRWACRASAIVAPIDILGSRLLSGSWKTICTSLRYALSAAPRSDPTSGPANVILPPDERTRRRIARPIVDLPDPLSPTSPRPNGPAATSSDTPSTPPTGPNRT